MPVSRDKLVDERHDALVFVELMVLNLEEEVVRPEHVDVLACEAAGVVVLVGHEGLIHVAAEARGHGDETFGMPRQEILVDARLVVKAVEVPGRDQVDEVAVAFLVFAEQDEVVVAVRCRPCSGVPAARRTLRSR